MASEGTPAGGQDNGPTMSLGWFRFMLIVIGIAVIGGLVYYVFVMHRASANWAALFLDILLVIVALGAISVLVTHRTGVHWKELLALVVFAGLVTLLTYLFSGPPELNFFWPVKVNHLQEPDATIVASPATLNVAAPGVVQILDHAQLKITPPAGTERLVIKLDLDPTKLNLNQPLIVPQTAGSKTMIWYTKDGETSYMIVK